MQKSQDPETPNTKIRKFQTPNAEIQKSINAWILNPRINTSQRPKIQKYENAEIQKYRNPTILKSRKHEMQTNPEIKKAYNAENFHSRYSEEFS